MSRSEISPGLKNEFTDSRMIRAPATMIMVPSMAEDMISILPWPKGWVLSGGWAERYSAYIPMHAATTLTMDSVASVNMATDPVRKYAMYLIIRRVNPRTTMTFWNSKFSSAAFM